MEVIRLEQVSKIYTHYAHGIDRLIEILTRHARHHAFTALHPLDLTVSDGQVLGIIGNNGAGKSTLLKLIAGTLQPSQGVCTIQGQVAALLELGGGFHPEMTGQENVYLNGSMMGLSAQAIERIYDKIVAFAGIETFMDQPIKTYSSGMFMRLAFAVATCVEPDILIIDEALSVGDGAFARKSFNRIMEFKQNRKTILFCSHALYQIEAICDRVIWLDQGYIQADGPPSQVVQAYTDAIAKANALSNKASDIHFKVVAGSAQIIQTTVSVDGSSGRHLTAISRQSELCITVHFVTDPQLPTPTIGLLIWNTNGQVITSAGSQHDGLAIRPDSQGHATVRVQFPQLALLKGEYWLDVYLLCEQAIHVYDQARTVAQLQVQQHGLEQGIVSLSRTWCQI